MNKRTPFHTQTPETLAWTKLQHDLLFFKLQHQDCYAERWTNINGGDWRWFGWSKMQLAFLLLWHTLSLRYNTQIDSKNDLPLRSLLRWENLSSFSHQCPNSKSMSLLKQLLKEAHSTILGDIDVQRLQIWPVAIPFHKIAGYEKEEDLSCARSILLRYYYYRTRMSWWLGWSPCVMNIHILVQRYIFRLFKPLLLSERIWSIFMTHHKNISLCFLLLSHPFLFFFSSFSDKDIYLFLAIRGVIGSLAAPRWTNYKGVIVVSCNDKVVEFHHTNL